MSVRQVAQIEEQQGVLDWLKARNPRAFGPDYDPYADGWRLGNQALGVFNALKDGEWRTLPEIGERVAGLASSHSARIRNIRDWLQEAGRGTIERRQREGTRRGNIEYRMVRTDGAESRFAAPAQSAVSLNGNV
jgi:hypothetical protein